MRFNQIYNEDCCDTIARMPDNFLDLVITSPPYNVNLGKNKYKKNGYDVYQDNVEHSDYIQWLSEVFRLIYKKTKDGGRCVINIGDGCNGRVPTHSDVIQFMNKIGWLSYSTIIWDKQHVSNRAAWGSYLKPSCPSFPSQFEYILIFAKKSRKLQSFGTTDLTKEEFINYTSSIWRVAPERNSYKKYNHPAVAPVEIAIRCIKMLSWKHAVVYDPFMGSGTTAVACKLTERFYIGSEISGEYVNTSLRRLENITGVNNG